MSISQRKILPIFLFVLGLHTISFLHGQGGCDPLTLQTPNNSLTYRGAPSAAGTYSLQAKVAADSSDRNFDLEIRNLRRSDDQQQVDAGLFRLGSTELVLGAGSEQLVVSLESQASGGSYSGELALIDQFGACPDQEIAFSIEILDPGSVRLEFMADDPSTNLIVPSWGNGWWPEQFNRAGIPFFIHNDGNVPVMLDSVNLLAMGKQSGQVLAVTNTYPGQVIGPGQKMPMQLLIDDPSLADSYVGDLSVSVSGLSQPITDSVTTNIKEGTFKALIWLILGFFAAYLFYLRDRFSGRLEVIGQLKNIRMLFAEVETSDAKNGLLAASRKIERDVQFKDSEEVKADVQLLREKAMGIIEAEETANGFHDQFPDKKGDIGPIFKTCYQLYLRGDMEGAAAKLQELKDMWNEAIDAKSTSRPRGGVRAAPQGGITNERGIDDGDEAGPAPAAPQKEVSQPWYQRLERYIIAFRRWWEWFINWWLVPITQLVAFLLVVYTGLNTVYVEDLTFGVNGMLDYIKLFLYAMVTNVFSEEVFVKRARSIVTEQTGEAGAPAPPAM